MNRLLAYVRTFSGFERDARIFLLTSLVAGAAISLYWIDFFLYLGALGIDPAVIGIVAAVANLSSALVSFPVGAASDRFGRRLVMAGGIGLMTLATVGFILTSSALVLALLAAVYAAGQQALFVVQSPYLAEHSRPEHRSELFSLQFAIMNVTNVVGAIGGGAIAVAVAGAMGLDPAGPGPYRVILVLMVGLSLAGLASLSRLSDDRPRRRHRPPPAALGEPAAFPVPHRSAWSAARLGIVILDRGRFVRLLLPGFLIALGAGQLIPFLNVFIHGKFGLDLGELNAVFALASLGTVIAILLQPALARRLGKVGAVVAVQAASLPFLVVLGFSPILWMVIIAMAVRNSLMNAGNPIQNAFAMEHVEPTERATLAAAQSQLWALGWVIAAPYYSILQAVLGFDAGYTMDFLTIIVLYSIGTALFWIWFRDAEGRRTTRIEAAAA